MGGSGSREGFWWTGAGLGRWYESGLPASGRRGRNPGQTTRYWAPPRHPGKSNEEKAKPFVKMGGVLCKLPRGRPGLIRKTTVWGSSGHEVRKQLGNGFCGRWMHDRWLGEQE